MCITRVGRVLSISGSRAEVLFFGKDSPHGVDISMVKEEIKKNCYVEVFGDVALKKLAGKEAERRKQLWVEVWGKGAST